MMRLRLASAVLLACCGSLVLSSLGSVAAQAQPTRQVRAWRASTVRVSPAPDDLVLVEIAFHGTVGRQRIWRETLRLAIPGPVGDDFLAVATPVSSPTDTPRVLVLIVNRPSPLLDPTSVRISLKTSRRLGTPVAHSLVNPITHHLLAGSALCDLALHGASALQAGVLRPLFSHGTQLTGFDASAALAQAYDLACGLPHETSFETAVKQAGSSTCRPVGTLCCPPTAICATPPEAPPPTPPPAPVPPACAPCDPAPGYACPLALPSVCVATAAGSGRRAIMGAY